MSVMALNGVSPGKTPAVFWCIARTLRSAGLAALPGRFPLPSCDDLGYGDWGFFLASERRIGLYELRSVPLPEGVRTLDGPGIAACFELPIAEAGWYAAVLPECDDGRTLYGYLLEAAPTPPAPGARSANFLVEEA